MKHALTLNIAIVVAVLVAIVVTANAMPLFAFFLLRDMPFGLLVNQNSEADDNPTIGFTAAI